MTMVDRLQSDFVIRDRWQNPNGMCQTDALMPSVSNGCTHAVPSVSNGCMHAKCVKRLHSCQV